MEVTMAEKPMRECRWCDRPFVRELAGERYCSRECRVTAKREARREESRRHHAKYRERRLDYHRRYRADNLEAVKAQQRERYYKMRESILGQKRKYWAENREILEVARRKRREANIEK